MQLLQGYRALIFRPHLGTTLRRTAAVVALGAFMLIASAPADAANIRWVSVAGAADQDFVSLVEGEGHTVTRFSPAGLLTPAQVADLNTADLVIIGRAVNSGDFDNANARPWNQQITTRLLDMSAYTTRRNRLGWAAGDGVPDSGPAQLVAADPAHPVFAGVTFQGDGATTVNDYNIMIDRGTTMIGSGLTGGTILATSALAPANIAIAEWAAGTVVTDDTTAGPNMILAGPRFYFAGGSREANGAAVATAGQLDLTEDGQTMFLNFVDYALTVPVVPEPSATFVLAGAAGLLLRRGKR